jgi:HK97 family phage portal protein
MKIADLLPWNKKSSRVTQAIVLTAHGQPQFSPRNFKAFMDEGFESNINVYSATTYIANACAGIKIKLYSKADKEILKHPKLDLLRKPNPEQRYADYLKSVVLYYLLVGNSYESGIGPSLTNPDDTGSPLKTPPLMLEVMRPDRIKVLPGTVNKVGGYRYDVGAQKITYDPSRVLHRKMFHPTSDWYGLSPLEPGGATVDTDNASTRWNLYLLQNNATPSGLIMVKGNLTEEQMDNLKKDVQLKYSGPENAGRPIVLESDGGAEWKQLSNTPKEMDWLKGRLLTARDICKLYGVPPQLLGDPDSQTYANFEMASKAFYQGTVCPLMDHIVDGWNVWFEQWWKDGSYLKYDRDDIEALQEDRDDLFKRYGEWFAGGLITANEARTAVGFDPATDELADERMIPNTLKPADVVANPPPPPPMPGLPGLPKVDPEDDDPEDKQKKCFDVRTSEHKAAYFKSIEAQRRSHTFKATASFKAQLKSDIRACASIVRKCDNLTHAKNEVEAYLKSESHGEWAVRMRKCYKGVIPDFGKRVVASLNRGKSVKDYTDWESSVDEYMAEHGGRKITSINDTTRDQVVSALDEAIDNGSDITEAAAAVDGIDTDYRAEMIGRTEVIGASNYGSLEGAYATGLSGLKKVWLSTIDDRTRQGEFDHVSADGETVDLDEEFKETGEPMDYPGDPTGDPGNVINCRCTVTYDTSGVDK